MDGFIADSCGQKMEINRLSPQLLHRDREATHADTAHMPDLVGDCAEGVRTS